jgi:hypothetical protein
MPELPLACALSPDGMTARLALIDALAADGLLDGTPTAAGLRVRCATARTSSSAPWTRRGESACCAFLELTLGRKDGDLVLDIGCRRTPGR